MNSGRKHIKLARKEWVACMHSIFTPKPDEHLWEWFDDARSYSEGRRIEANNFTLAKTNQRTELSLEAAHIMTCFDVSKYLLFRHVSVSFSRGEQFL